MAASFSAAIAEWLAQFHGELRGAGVEQETAQHLMRIAGEKLLQSRDLSVSPSRDV